MHFFHRRSIFRLVIVTFCTVIFYNEFLVFYLTSLSWPDYKCGDLNNLHSILLVADPQILGEQTEIWIARWDNDRYLRRAFAAAFHSVMPEMVVFLGDLMDEGFTATDQEYRRHYARFRDIFRLDYIPANKTVFLPGDNDIGGEDELVSEAKVRRFYKFFPPTTVTTLGSTQIVQVDKMRGLIPTVPQAANMTRVVVTHMPLLGLPSNFAYEVLQKLRPQVVISAHNHKSMHFSGDLETGERLLVEALRSNQHTDSKVASWRFQGSDHIVNEVMVPTCSYRMGVPEMGFGLALFDERGEAWCYHVLWLPSRFLALFSYIVLLSLLLVLLCVSSVYHKLPWQRLRKGRR